jgi:hypothetical protein
MQREDGWQTLAKCRQAGVAEVPMNHIRMKLAHSPCNAPSPQQVVRHSPQPGDAFNVDFHTGRAKSFDLLLHEDATVGSCGLRIHIGHY